jgi:hypothetical protein
MAKALTLAAGEQELVGLIVRDHGVIMNSGGLRRVADSPPEQIP